MSTSLAMERADNRHCFMKILGSLRYLAKQGCGFRKSDDSEGNLYQLLKFTGEDDPKVRRNNIVIIKYTLYNNNNVASALAN